MNKSVFANTNILNNASTAHHGTLNYAELLSLNINPNQVLDFSSNINPYGPPPNLIESLFNIDVSQYPDRDSIDIRKAISKIHKIKMDQVIIGNGTAEIIFHFALSYIQAGDKVLILGPTFGEYERCVRLVGGKVILENALAENNFQFMQEDIEEALKNVQPIYCFICNPNNPTGSILDIHTIQALGETNPDIGFIIDEAYLPFVPEHKSAITLGLPNLFILKSMTKDYSLAGLRLGYAIGPKEIITDLSKVRPAWNVNTFAQDAGEKVLAQIDFMNESNQKLRVEKEILISSLKKLGYLIPPSETQYFLIEVGNASEFRLRLLQEHFIQVRDCTSFGLPSYIRVSTRRREDNDRLLSAIKGIRS